MDRSENMRAIRSKDTLPEKTVRSLVHGLGYRFRLHRRNLPGKPDLVFPARLKVIFIHGCFWHSHGCKAGLIPKSNRSFWLPKLERNVERDHDLIRKLQRLGWRVLVIWECEIRDRDKLVRKLTRFLDPSKKP